MINDIHVRKLAFSSLYCGSYRSLVVAYGASQFLGNKGSLMSVKMCKQTVKSSTADDDHR